LIEGGVPKEKINGFHEFFKFDKHIEDPIIVTGESDEDRYDKCLLLMQEAIHNHIDQVIDFLDRCP
jgi:hypothetical protein